MTGIQGILPAKAIGRFVDEQKIRIARPLDGDQIQPASLDLRLGDIAYRVRASFLPGPKLTVAARLKDLSLHQIALAEGAVLEVGCVYIVPLLESLVAARRYFGGGQPQEFDGPA